MNILITGIAGFIGSNLADLLAKKDTIIGIDNYDPFYDKSIKENNLRLLKKLGNFVFYENDILDFSALDAVFANHHIDLIVHLAAKAGVRPKILRSDGAGE